MVLDRNADIVTHPDYIDAHFPEGVGDDAQLIISNIFDEKIGGGHGSQTDKASNFDHVGKQAVLAALQRGHPMNVQQVGACAVNFCPIEISIRQSC